jgi:hypothetical protein
VNFFGLAGVFVVVDDVIADYVEIVCLVEVVVVADMDLLVGEVSSEDIPPSLKRDLPATHGELQAIYGPCYQPDPRCICESIVFTTTMRSIKNIALDNRIIVMPHPEVCSFLQMIR